MSPEVTRRKLKLLIEHLNLLKKYKKADIVTVNKNHLAIERLLQLIVEISCDINYHLIVLALHAPPKDLHSSFLQMAEIKVIPLNLAKALAPSAGLRNALVHMYDDIDIELIQKSIHSTLKLFPEYIKHVEVFSGKL